MSYPTGLKRSELRALGLINESPDPATARDWWIAAAVALVFLGAVIFAFWFVWARLGVPIQL